MIKIQNGVWNKDHLLEAVNRITKNNNFKGTHWIEMGYYRGESLALLCDLQYAKQFPIGKIWGIDAQMGLPEEAPNVERFYLFNKGIFSDVHYLYPLKDNGEYLKYWFKDLNAEIIKKHGIKPLSLIHIDSDIFQSCVEALDFLFGNNLVLEGATICFDEFKSTSTLIAGGESLSWKLACDKYKIEAEEYFRNVYFDRIECWQNCFEIKSIGSVINYGIDYEN